MVRTGLLSFKWRGLLAAGALVSLFLLGGHRPSRSEAENETTRSTSIDRGEYLVHDVAMCIKCHTPKNRRGELIETELLEGARIPVESPYPNQDWALKAPHIAGLPGGWTEDALAHFLQTGETPTGFPIRPPMPPFRMKAQDARDVAAYLHSLGTN